MSTYLEMYRGAVGAEGDVWRQLVNLGDLEEGSSLWEDAYSVALESMQRARRNIARIIEYLQQNGYHFEDPPFSEEIVPWGHPTADTPEQIQRVIGLVGALPLSLRAWWEVVGGVSLQGSFATDWSDEVALPMTDPLMVKSIHGMIRGIEWDIEHGFWSDTADSNSDSGHILDISPDIYHKAHTSGGDPYQIDVPDNRADAPLLNVIVPDSDGTGEWFVDYLRRSFKWAGFPGCALEVYPDISRIEPLFAEMLLL